MKRLLRAIWDADPLVSVIVLIVCALFALALVLEVRRG